jgi:hypothetical protein
MRSANAKRQFEIAECIAIELLNIEIIDPEFIIVREDIIKEKKVIRDKKVKELELVKTFGALRGRGLNEILNTGFFLNKCANKYDWLQRGARSVSLLIGDVNDCAAAAAYLLLVALPSALMHCKIEIVSCGRQTIVVVNRNGPLCVPVFWGEDAFLIDIGTQNHWPDSDGKLKAVIWATEFPDVENTTYMESRWNWEDNKEENENKLEVTLN